MNDYYDIFPLVFLVNVPQEMTIKPYGYRKNTHPIGTEYKVNISEVERANDNGFPGSNSLTTETATVGDDGLIRFTHTFPREGMYFISVEGIPELRVYALNEDMKGRRPYRGDLHMHTNRSDGAEPPQVVAANYRGHGYDFTVISDHHVYYPSLYARKYYHIDKKDESDITDLLIVPGEEVHLPGNAVHYVNFGGKFSINALITPNCNQEAGDDINVRSFDGKAPDTITQEEFHKEIAEIAKNVPLELESERISFATAKWIYEKQKQAGGLGIFPHPYWLCSTMQLSQDSQVYYGEERAFISMKEEDITTILKRI